LHFPRLQRGFSNGFTYVECPIFGHLFYVEFYFIPLEDREGKNWVFEKKIGVLGFLRVFLGFFDLFAMKEKPGFLRKN